jgi:hypothetical protein
VDSLFNFAGRGSNSRKINFSNDMEKFKKTMITFDKGGIWEPLKPPKGDPICVEDEFCSLHLNSISDMRYGPLYSVDNAVGILISTGNVGYHLA